MNAYAMDWWIPMTRLVNHALETNDPEPRVWSRMDPNPRIRWGTQPHGHLIN